jgi:purine nucleoside phosphorylase
MSNVNETIALRHMGVKNIIGISILCNAGAGLSLNPLSHEEVTKAANQKKDDLARAIISTITTPME